MHEVLLGQSLWQIAIAYDVEIDEIKRLNNLVDNDIYPGNKLLIKRGVAVSSVNTDFPTPAATPTSLPAVTFTATATSTQPAAMPVSKSASLPASNSNNSIMGIAIGIIVIALLGGGFFTWLGTSKNE
jgi:LysM repeat protein